MEIYLDNNATTPVDERVLEEMLPYFTRKYGNAASRSHAYGWTAAEAVENAREKVARLLNCEPGEIIFNSGATEGINLALKGVFENYQAKGNHIITVATEHKAVLDTCRALEQKGADITYLPVNRDGQIDLAQLEQSIRKNTILICVMYANNETGVIQDIAAIGDFASRHGIMFMSDVTQAMGKIPVDMQQLKIDIAPLSAHKFYGPKGVGALFVRRRGPRVTLAPQMDGGGHEKGLRSGTLNVPGIVGLGKAVELVINELEQDEMRVRNLRDQLQQALLGMHGVVLNGSLKHRTPNTLNVSFTGLTIPTILAPLCKTVAVSSGSACTSALMEPSYVLKAMGIDDDTAYASIRFSLGRFTTAEEINYVIERVREIVLELKL